MAVAFLAITPFFALGNPSGHDFEFHMFSWMEVVRQWKQGIWFPRWASLAHWTYGEARFLFYPPASWSLGAVLGALLPWKMAPGAYIWLALTACGCSMFLLARRWLGRADALFAAALYSVNPYHLVIVYWRSALAELLASCLLPLLLINILKAPQEGRRVVLPLSLLVAASWLINVPSAVMVNYSLALLAVIVAVVGRCPRVLLYAAIAVAVGAGLASFYLVPAGFEQRWVNIGEVLSPGVRPFDNFLFTRIPDPDHNRFNLLISIVAIAEMLIVLACLYLLRKRRADDPAASWCLTGWAVAAILLVCSLTYPLWKLLPELRFVQLPWRWLLCLDVALALLATVALRRWLWRALLCAGMVVLLWSLWHGVQQPWWATADDVEEMHDAVQDGTGYEGVDEYVPTGVDPYELKKTGPEVAVARRSTAHIRILDWSAQSKRFTAEVARPEKLRLRLLNYPAWRVEVNGVRINARSQPVTGEIVVPLETGISAVRVTFVQTADRLAGGLISAATLTMVIAWLMYETRPDWWLQMLARFHMVSSDERADCPLKRVLVATSNPGKLRDFAGAALSHKVEVAAIPHFSSLTPVVEDGHTFQENARKKAEQYSLAVPGEILIADDSGLEVDALGGAPGVHSARYAADEPHKAGENTDDAANNARVLRELEGVAPEQRTGRFVCVIVAARDGQTLATFRGVAEGRILDHLQGTGGFGYDPMFYFPEIQKTFAELTPEEKSRYSHRGDAFRQFLAWLDARQKA